MSRELAKRILPLIDLTSLNDAQDDDIPGLCAKAVTKFGPVAAVCSWPQFTAEMKQRLQGTEIAVAVVIDFPNGAGSSEAAGAEAKEAISAGADELDLVFPYRFWLAGDRQRAINNVAAVKTVTGQAKLKVILETGAFESVESIAEAAEDAIAAGADLLKTSTGKIATGATPKAAKALLGVIKDCGRDVGFKASGGIRSLADAATYLEIAEAVLGPSWIMPARFRIGASRLQDNVLAELEGAG